MCFWSNFTRTAAFWWPAHPALAYQPTSPGAQNFFVPSRETGVSGWALLHGCPVPEASLESCLLKILQWLSSQDPPCSWDDNVCLQAKEHRHHDVLGWALLHGCPAHQAFLESLRTWLMFLTCLVHQLHSIMHTNPDCTLGHDFMMLSKDVIQHIATFI